MTTKKEALEQAEEFQGTITAETKLYDCSSAFKVLLYFPGGNTVLKSFPYTPEPELKPGMMCDFSDDEDFDAYVTGRYQCANRDAVRPHLCKGVGYSFKYCRPHISHADELLNETMRLIKWIASTTLVSGTARYVECKIIINKYDAYKQTTKK